MLLQSWRWFGPADVVPLSSARQAGAEGIVTALHHFRCGDVWTKDEVKKQQQLVEAAGMQWVVVESVPVHEQIKTGGPERDKYIQNYIQSLHAIAACGIKTVCYNFMPVLDWTRTDLNYSMPDGSRALLFNKLDYIAFETLVLKRKNAIRHFSNEETKRAEQQWSGHTEEKRQEVINTLLMGLPGTVDDLTIEEFKEHLSAYDSIDENQLRENYLYFLRKIIPEAEALGIRMTVHPDDPPMPIFGLPRIVSTEKDCSWVIDSVPSPANGLCFCTGSLSARADNDLPGMVMRLGHAIHFFHLRSVQRMQHGSFYEANHLEGDARLVEVMKSIVQLLHQRKERIPMRPDHGHQMLDDLKETKAYGGYTAIGRLRGLAELRGLELGIESMMKKE